MAFDDMEFRVVILMVTCLSCILPVRPAPFVKVAAVGAAVEAVKGAARAFLVQKVTMALKGALAAKGALLKQVALKTAAHSVTLGAGAALGAAVVAHQPHFDNGETYLEHHVPYDHGYHYDHPQALETLHEPIYHEQAHVPYQPTYHEFPAQEVFHHEDYSGLHYR